ncbi:MAG: hypothetical protein GF401_20255, partial [Chitinivibrionales bacterium]|nr:hypothetical protein [Chitinivibrionales bacterium]
MSTGCNLNYSYQSNFDEPTHGLGVDLGLSYRLLRHPLLGTHITGLTFQNIASFQFDKLDRRREATQIKALLHSSFLENFIEMDWQVDISDLVKDAELFTGGQSPSLEWDVA